MVFLGQRKKHPFEFAKILDLEPLVKRMQEKKVGTVVITNSSGKLIGILFRKDGEERLKQDQAQS